ncbi:MAG: hypothetical protein ACJ786_00130 [Catenulispora sp.]
MAGATAAATTGRTRNIAACGSASPAAEIPAAAAAATAGTKPSDTAEWARTSRPTRAPGRPGSACPGGRVTARLAAGRGAVRPRRARGTAPVATGGSRWESEPGAPAAAGHDEARLAQLDL